MKIYIIWSKSWCKAREKKYGMGKKSSQQLADNGKPSLMAHKLSCLTTHFAQLPIHHANTNAPMQRMLSTTTITTAMPKVKRSKKATDTKKKGKNEWHQMKWHTNTHNYLMYLSRRITQNYLYSYQQQSTMHQSLLPKLRIGHTLESVLCHYHCYLENLKRICAFIFFVFSWDYFSLLYFMQWTTQWKYRWKKKDQRDIA